MNTLKDKSKQYKWQIAAFVFILLIVIFLWVLPLIISQQFQKWVLANGGEEVSVENVDFNIFTAHFRIDNVVIKRSGYQPLLLPTLELKGKLSDLIDKRFVVSSLKLEGVKLTIDHTEPRAEHIGGILFQNLASADTRPPKEDAEPWSFNIQELTLSNFSLSFKHPELSSHLLINKLKLTNLDNLPNASSALLEFSGTLDESPISLNGKITPFASEPGFEGNLSLTELNLEPYQSFVTGNPGRQAYATINTDLEVKQLSSGRTVVNQNGIFILNKIKLLENNLKISADSFNWDGDINISLDKSQSIQTKGKGNLKLTGINLDQEQNQSIKAKNIDWQGNFDVELASDARLTTAVNGSLISKDFNFISTNNDITLENASIDWQGTLKVEKSGSQLNILSDGKLLNEGLEIAKPEQALQLVNNSLAWQGNARFSFKDGNSDLQSSSQLRLNQFSLSALDDTGRLLSINEAQLDEIEIKSIEELNLLKVSLKDLSVGSLPKVENIPENLPGFANYDELIFDKLSFSEERGLYVNRIAQAGVRHAVLKDESGQWMFFSLLRTLNKATGNKQTDRQKDKASEIQDSETGASETQDSGTIAFSIDTLETVDTGEIYYIDQTLPDTFSQKVKIDNFKLTNIDSSTKKPSQLNLITQINDAKIEVKGNIALFDKNKDFDLTASINALSLLPYSYFMEKGLGYQVDSGSLNATGKYTAKDAVLESATELTLYQLDVRALTEAELKALDATQNSGLETGLSMLKDKNDTIKLNIPVNGKFEDLKVDPSDIINQALGSALKTGAKTYFAAALFPFGTLLVVADAVGSNAMQVNLDPVFFAPEQVNLESKYQEYLKKVSVVLDEKPEIHIKICGVAVTDDKNNLIKKQEQLFQAELEKLKQANEKTKNNDDKAESKDKAEPPKFIVDQDLLERDLKALAKNRGSSVTRYLIDKQSVDPKRLTPCQPRLDLQDNAAKPRTELSI